MAKSKWADCKSCQYFSVHMACWALEKGRVKDNVKCEDYKKLGLFNKKKEVGLK